jgi:hypothetical protein
MRIACRAGKSKRADLSAAFHALGARLLKEPAARTSSGHIIRGVVYFCRIHKTLRVTPAMESGLTDHVWTVKELFRRLFDHLISPW